jgi:hypothetical protein
MNRGAMNLDYVSPYFNLTVAASRAAGARGGRRSGETRRARKLDAAIATTTQSEVGVETAHEASMVLDAQFPWLRDAEHRSCRHPRA